MSVASTNGTFNPATQMVAARGSFNQWNGPFLLTNNPSGANSNLWRGTTTVPGYGAPIVYEYSIEPGSTLETIAYQNYHPYRVISLPPTNGSTVTCPLVFFGDSSPSPVTTQVRFQVDMAEQINFTTFLTNVSSVYVRGYFNNFGLAGPMTNDPSILRTNDEGLVTSNVYVGVFSITGSPGETLDYFYSVDTPPNYDQPAAATGDPDDGNSRFFSLAAGGNQTLPIVFFDDIPYKRRVHNTLTFQVDMSGQVLGRFDPAKDVVSVFGSFNNHQVGVTVCTNNPTASNTNLYVAIANIDDFNGATQYYQFCFQGTSFTDYETPSESVINGERFFTLINTNSQDPPSHIYTNTQILPPVFYSDQPPADFLTQDTVVTFSVGLTNAVGTDSHVFDPAHDHVFINGVPDFGTWSTSLPMLTNNPVGSGIYSIDLLVQKGNLVKQTYKYGINGADDEAAAGNNHVRYIRAVGTYVMPQDTFGDPESELGYFLGLSVTGNGTVSANPNLLVYPSNTVIQLTANPSPGWSFLNWSGDTNGAANPLTLVMNTNKFITANFVTSGTLTVSVIGGGTVLKAPDQTLYPANSTVLLKAIPAPGWSFLNWTGDVAGANNPVIVQITTNKSVTAIFSSQSLQPVCTPPPSGLLAWWPGSGNANDVIANNNGTLQNGATFAPGKIGTALSFDGVNDYVLVPDSRSLDISSGLTIEAWVKTSGTADYARIVSKYYYDPGAVGNNNGYGLGFDNGGRMRCDIGDGFGSYAFAVNSTVVTDGLWHHVAAVFNPNEVNLYVDGVAPVYSPNLIGFAPNTTQPLYLGQDPAAPGRFYTGLLDEVSIYSRALSASEVQAIYSAGSAGKCLSPVYITSVNRSGNNVNLAWLSQKGMRYRVESCSDITSRSWATVVSPGEITATGSSTSALVPDTAAQRFYRVVMLQ